MVALMGQYNNYVIHAGCTAVISLLFRYSRKILWLKVSSSNNNPAYIAHFYAECLRLIGGIIYTEL